MPRSGWRNADAKRSGTKSLRRAISHEPAPPPQGGRGEGGVRIDRVVAAPSSRSASSCLFGQTTLASTSYTQPAPGDEPGSREATRAERTLQLLNGQADAVRADLAKLRRELARAREELSGLRAAHLQQADEQLVLAAVHADTAAQTAVSSLDELARYSQYDELTGAPNRALMFDRLQGATALAQRRSTRLAVLFVDLDGFKGINDTLGHAVGDEVLQLATHRLQASVRESDMVSRHSGDEFLVLLTEISQGSDAAQVAAKMLSALATPARVGPHPVRLSASVGIAVYPEDGTDPVTLIGRADAAMYRAKRRGPGGFEFHDVAFGEDAGEALAASVVAPPQKRPDSALAQHEARLRELLDANHELLGAAQIAHKLQSHAEEAHRRQINFVAMAAHAMRTPLSSIQMAAAVLARTTAGNSASRDILKRQSTHLARLIDDLLDGSMVGAGEFKLALEVLDIDATIGAAVDTCRHWLDAKRQTLTLQADAGKAMLRGDSMRLAQVFSNLLNNASRRAPEGGSILLATMVFGTQLQVMVADDGPAIPPAALPLVFDLFAVDANIPADESGLGIGLAVVKELVRAHGGTAFAKNKAFGAGSEFVVRLPLVVEQGGSGRPGA